MLSAFDAVGRTEELGTFLAYLHALLADGSAAGASAAEPANSTSDRRVNDTPERQKYDLTSEERALTYTRTALDAQLYESLCGGSKCALRQARSSAELQPRSGAAEREVDTSSSEPSPRCGTRDMT